MRIALSAFCFYLMTVLAVMAQEQPADPKLPIVTVEKGIPTFRTGIGMTEIERMITLSATGCITQQEIDGQITYFPPCGIVEELRVALSKASQREPLGDFLTTNDFKCQKAADGTKCRNEFKTILTPPKNVLTGKQENPDIENTFITEVAFKQTKPEPLSANDIRVKSTRLQR